MSTNYYSRLSPELQMLWEQTRSKYDKANGNMAADEFNKAVYRAEPHLKDKDERRLSEDLAYNDENRQQNIDDKIAEINQINKKSSEFQNKFGRLGGKKGLSRRRRSHKKRTPNKKSSRKMRNCKKCSRKKCICKK